MISSHPLISLLEQDQSNIRQYKTNKISQDDFASSQERVVEQFKSYIKSKGFPFRDVFGQEVYKAAIVLSLHADVEFLKLILENIKEVGEGQIDVGDKAYFIDRLLVLEGKSQVYGTQYKKSSDGDIEFFPIEDNENVDKRRSELGLGPLSEYKVKANSK
ncbi:MAG: hypothetical protein Q8O98_02665 [bacterium]|nr:hypothetical protein [bacterium]